MLAMASLLWVKKKNGFTILNPANGKFGLRHYPRLPTAYEYITTIVDFFQPIFQAIFGSKERMIALFMRSLF